MGGLFVGVHNRRGGLPYHPVQLEPAVNGVEAMLRFIENDYRFVMLDIAMPRMDGADTLRLMKKLKPDVPVVTFTGHVGRGDRIAAL